MGRDTEYSPGSADTSGNGSNMNAPTNVSLNPPVVEAAEVRVAQYNWKGLTKELNSHGCAVIVRPRLLRGQALRLKSRHRVTGRRSAS
jgi:hypothetical protein